MYVALYVYNERTRVTDVVRYKYTNKREFRALYIDNYVVVSKIFDVGVSNEDIKLIYNSCSAIYFHSVAEGRTENSLP